MLKFLEKEKKMATIRHKFNKSYFEGGAYFCGQFHVPGNIKLSNDLAVDGYQLTEISAEFPLSRKAVFKHFVRIIQSPECCSWLTSSSEIG